MPRPALLFFCCILAFSLLLLHCTSLSQDGLILLKMKKVDWRDTYNTKALNDWNGSEQNPCAWNGIFCDTFNTVTKVDLNYAYISGNLSSDICGLPNLTVLILNSNEFSGPFPNGLLDCKRLQQLDLSNNKFSGTLPSRISELRELRELNLAGNAFSGAFPHGLLHCKRLRKIDLSRENQFAGRLPIRISELSELKELNLAYNDFKGPFPPGLLDCKRLQKLDLSVNLFAGTLPSRISELSELRELKLAYNAFSGSIPLAFGMLPKLKILFLNDNSLNGTFSNFVGNLKSLVDFRIDSNPLLPSVVPRELGDLKQLQTLSLHNCNLVGGLPDFLGSLTQLQSLDMSHNNLWGNIPSSLMALSNMRELFLGDNKLSGKIPRNIDQLEYLSELDLSENNLSGRIPPQLGMIRELLSLDVSNNHLSGRIPDALDNPRYEMSFLNNPGLCGGQTLNLPSCSSLHMLASILLAPLFIAAVALSSICFCRSSLWKQIDTPLWKKTPFISTEVDETYILRNLKESNVIGTGGAGKVYKVILQNGQAVAVKKIRNTGRPAGNSKRKGEHEENKIGEVEVDILGLIRHTNILKLLCCISNEESDFKLLVYEFMPNGSLFDSLHGDPVPEMVLQWPTRYQIALGAARGLSYMHHDCSPPILHRDVKSSNILLDGDFTAKIADFGVSRVLDKLGDEYMASGYVGSHGYIAPEYGHILKVSEKSDIYSFGVVVLELVTGMKATNEAYGEGVDLVEWIHNTIGMGRGEDRVLDGRIQEESCIEQMLRVLRVGLVCTNRDPKRRPSMRTVVELLE